MTIAPVTVASTAAMAAIATKGVVRLDKGPVGSVATYGGGRRVPGIQVHDRGTEGPQVHVHIVVTLDRPIPLVTQDVRDAVVTALEAVGDSGRAVHVHVTDIDTDSPADSGHELPPITEELE